MNTAEAHDLAFNHIEFAHELGEAINRQSEFWVSVSYGILVLAFVAPHALNRVTTPLVLVLYILFSVSMMNNASFDLATARASMNDAKNLIQTNEIKLATFEEKSRPQKDTGFRIVRAIGELHLPGLFIATIGYVIYASFVQGRRRSQSSADYQGTDSEAA